MVRLAHISDLHFGRGLARGLADALHESVIELAPDGLLISGDLVNWGESDWMWRRFDAFMSRFDTPMLVVPGNHDIARAHLWQRARDPFRGFARHVRPPEDTVLRLPGATIVGLTTPRRWTADLGHVSRAQLRFAREQFEAGPVGNLRAVVMHHGLEQLSPWPIRDCVRGRRVATWALAEMGAEIVMTGHNHFPHLALLGPEGGRRFVWSQAGTSGAGRLRALRVKRQSFSLVETDADQLRIRWYFFEGPGGGFERGEEQLFDRATLACRSA